TTATAAPIANAKQSTGRRLNRIPSRSRGIIKRPLYRWETVPSLGQMTQLTAHLDGRHLGGLSCPGHGTTIAVLNGLRSPRPAQLDRGVGVDPRPRRDRNIRHRRFDCSGSHWIVRTMSTRRSGAAGWE